MSNYKYGDDSEKTRKQAEKELHAIGDTNIPENAIKYIKWELKYGVHPDKDLQADYNKYGETAFVIELTPQYSTIEEALEAMPNATRIKDE
jgi:hypothetical protein